MAMLKLFPVATPTSATQVTSTKTPVRQVIISSSNATTFTVGDSTLTNAASGIVQPAATALPLVIGNHNPAMGFDLSELYVIAASGNVNILALLF